MHASITIQFSDILLVKIKEGNKCEGDSEILGWRNLCGLYDIAVISPGVIYYTILRSFLNTCLCDKSNL